MKLNEDPWETRKPLIHDTIHILSQAELKFEGKVSEICKNAHKNVIHDLQVYFDQILAEVCYPLV